MESTERKNSRLSSRMERDYNISELNNFLYSLGYDKILEGLNMEEITADKRKKLILVTDYLRVVLRETMKSSKDREISKMLTFLNMAMKEMDRFHLEEKNEDRHTHHDSSN